MTDRTDSFRLRARAVRLPLRGGAFRAVPAPAVMAILNLTPDSFSDGHAGSGEAPWESRLDLALESGAQVLDFGGESTRPGAKEVPADEEIRRVLPWVKRARSLDPDRILSVDTRHEATARAALELGADWVNDVSGGAFSGGGTLRAARDFGAGLVLMHMRGTPETMANDVDYADVVGEVTDELARLSSSAAGIGLAPESVLLDPGVGFAKTTEQNLSLLRALPRLRSIGHEILVGVSRKRVIGELTGRNVGDRLAGTLGMQIACARRGAAVIRCHDPRAFLDAWKCYAVVEEEGFSAVT